MFKAVVGYALLTFFVVAMVLSFMSAHFGACLYFGLGLAIIILIFR
jgi:hypothetical protein